jgi:hypothetical protein
MPFRSNLGVISLPYLAKRDIEHGEGARIELWTRFLVHVLALHAGHAINTLEFPLFPAVDFLWRTAVAMRLREISFDLN